MERQDDAEASSAAPRPHAPPPPRLSISKLPKAHHRLLLLSALAAGAAVGYFVTPQPDPAQPYKLAFSSGLGFARAYQRLAPVLLPWVDPEAGHTASVRALSLSHTARSVLGLTSAVADPPELHCSAFHLSFPSPLGIAAGYDKHGECIDGLLEAGFGWVEVGSVTPEPQPGNERPRLFRLYEDRAVINRYGFNSHGLARVRQRLDDRRRSTAAAAADSSAKAGGEGRVLGINLGKNKTSASAVEDYKRGLRELHAYGDYFVINVSSPNTPGLRDLQGRRELQALLSALVQERDGLASASQRSLPLLLKIAPDLSEADKRDIAEVALATGIDGLVICNTTLSRPESLKSPHRSEAGGLSGAPLRDVSTQLIREMFLLTDGRLPIVGVGGVASGDDVVDKLRAGACLVQLYTAFSYEGPAITSRIKAELLQRLRRDGVVSVQDIVGADVKPELARRRAVADASTVRAAVG